MVVLVNSTFALNILAMVGSIGLVIWSLQIKNGNLLAMVSGVLLFVLSVLSLTYTGFVGGKMLMNPGSESIMMMERLQAPAGHMGQ